MIIQNRVSIPRFYLAVDFFFVLSGFVVAYAYLQRLRDDLGFFKFCLLRAIRLYPLIALGTVLGAAHVLWMERAATTDLLGFIAAFVGSLFAIPTPHVSFSYSRWPLNPPEWSLTYEVAASLIFGVFLFKISLRQLFVIIAISLGCLYVFTAFHDPSAPAGTSFKEVARIAFSFSMGVALYSMRHKNLLSRFSLSMPALYLLVFGTTCVPVQFGWMFDMLATTLLFPAIIILGSNHRGRSGEDWLNRKLGDLSYPLYILHWPVILLTRDIFGAHFDQLSVLTIVASLTALAVAWIAFTVFDKPVRRFLVAAVTG
jgi:peptidoglycan/LPS O-acetylase OafA/YrhL